MSKISSSIVDRKVVVHPKTNNYSYDPKTNNYSYGKTTDQTLAWDLVFGKDKKVIGLQKSYVPLSSCYVKSGVQESSNISKKDLRNWTTRAWKFTNGDSKFFVKLKLQSSIEKGNVLF